uniref:Protein VTS1 n=1 Tax=Anthurium amnicola TaxID=1678845 RepID=A0A1D1YH38_9ARAE
MLKTDRVPGLGRGSFPVLKMFEWNEDEEVRDTIWGVLNETEDHLVPYPSGSEHDTPCTLERPKKQMYEQTGTNPSIPDHTKSTAKNDFPGPGLENISNFHANGEFSASRFHMDTWPDLPSSNSAFGKGYVERNHLHSMSSKCVNDCPRSPNINKLTENMFTKFYDADAALQNRDPYLKGSCNLSALDIAQLDSEPDIFVNEHEDKESDSFLNCDWDNIADFDDLDIFFRSGESIFGHELIGKKDEILSPSMDADSTTVPSFPMHVEDNSAEIGMHTICHSQRKSDDCGIHAPLSCKVDRRKKLSKSRKKMEKCRANPPRNSSSSCPSNTSSIQQLENVKMPTPLKSPLDSFQSPALCSHREGRGTGEPGQPWYIGVFPGASHHFLPDFEYPIPPFPTVPMVSPAHPERKQNQAIAGSQIVYPAFSKHKSSVQSKPLPMTPQKKIEKLRRRQQMQALVAIQQQQKHLEQQSSSIEISVSQTISETNQSHGVDETAKWLSSSELNMPQEGDESHMISTLVDDSLGETFYQLQDAMGKLDVGVRLCIRDSLFRLARSAMERHNASDRSSTNKSSTDEYEALLNEETNSQDRSTRLPTEACTNPIDRTVANLLFHWPSEQVV